MPTEIERKFLVTGDWMADSYFVYQIEQAYLLRGPTTVRLRTSTSKQKSEAYITVKGPTVGISRLEFEYPIPFGDAQTMFALCEQPILRKTRYHHVVHVDNTVHQFWEIDRFEDGLVLAEIELKSDTEVFVKPAWLGEEVSHDPRYYNSNLPLKDKP